MLRVTYLTVHCIQLCHRYITSADIIILSDELLCQIKNILNNAQLHMISIIMV